MSFSSLVRFPGKLLGGSPPAPTRSPRDKNRADRSIQQLRYARVLSGLDGPDPPERECKRAWKQMQDDMALVPAGTTQLFADSFRDAEGKSADEFDLAHTVEVQGLFMDRMAVTNADFYQFARNGGYDNLDLWPGEIWQNVVQFIDQTGQPGPRWWSGGKPLREQLNQPVVGVCWFEAAAYANWVGKRLPMSAEWQRAGTWHVSQDGRQAGMKYPWGESFEISRANTWSSGLGKTAAVSDYYDGCTPNGIYQLVGNVWEWTNSRYECGALGNSSGNQDFGEIRGGAFDTYFPSQVTCQYRTGQSLLFRANNIGFRCCVPVSQLLHVPGKSLGD